MTGLPTSSNTLKNIYCVFIFKLFSYYTIFHLDFIAILHTVFSIFFIGSFLNEKAVSGVCGALLTNIAGWLSGVFIPIDLIGGAFKAITNILSFYHSVEAIKLSLINGDFSNILPHLSIVMGYTGIIFVFAIITFNRKMAGEKA